MSHSKVNRRRFLHSSTLGVTGGILASSTFPFLSMAATKAASDRLQFGAIGVGGKGASIANSARRLSDIVAVCDLDTHRIDRVNKSLAKGKATGYQD